MQTRREMIRHSGAVASLLAAAGVWPALAQAQSPVPRAAFQAASRAEVYKALGLGAPVPSPDVTLQAPDIAENGAAVPVSLATSVPNATRLLLLVEKNPNVLAAAFDLHPGLEPALALRIKMNQSSNVYAVALTADGRALYAVKDVKVTLGGCGV